jgi:hypothetical protein
MADTPGVANVKIICLCCKLEFAGAKKSIGNRDRNSFVVKSTGLTLHLRAIQCQGVCRKFYIAHKLPLNTFSLSPPSVEGGAPPPVLGGGYKNSTTGHEINTNLLSQSCTFGVDTDSIDDLATLEPQGDIKSKSTSTALTHTMSYLDSFISSLEVESGNTPDSHGNPTTTTTTTFTISVPKNHLLDKVLFHQKHVPYIPRVAQYSPSTFLKGASSPLLDPGTTAQQLALQESILDVSSLNEAISDADLESVGSSSHDSLGSYQTATDDNFILNDHPEEIMDVPVAAVVGDGEDMVTNWMVSKKVEFDLKQMSTAPPTHQLKVETSLLQLLDKHKAPLSLYNSITEWAQESARMGHDFRRKSRSRSSVLSELEDRYDFRSAQFQPTIVSYLPDERPTIVYVSSFADAVYSMLSNPELMDEHNLAFPDPFNPFLCEPEDPALRTNEVSELHHGDFYKATHKEVCTGPLDVLCLYICYMDGVSTDAFGRLGLTPLNITLGILNSSTRTKKEAWVTLYFHPDDNAEAAYHVHKTTAFHKV